MTDVFREKSIVYGRGREVQKHIHEVASEGQAEAEVDECDETRQERLM